MDRYRTFGLGILCWVMLLGCLTACDSSGTFEATPDRDREIEKFLEIFRYTLLDGNQQEYLNLFSEKSIVFMPELGRAWVGKPQVLGLYSLFHNDFKSFEIWFWDHQVVTANTKAMVSFQIKFLGVHPEGSKEFWTSSAMMTMVVEDGIWRIDSLFAKDTPFDIKPSNALIPPQSLLVSKAKLKEMIENMRLERPFLFGFPPGKNPMDFGLNGAPGTPTPGLRDEQGAFPAPPAQRFELPKE